MEDPIFGEVIYAYTRAQAIEDGVLVDVTEIAKEAGFKIPVAVTQGVWAECVVVPKGCEGLQDEQGRLWDVVWMLRVAIDSQRRQHPFGADFIKYKLHVVQRVQDITERETPPLVSLKARCGPGDNAEPVITIMLPNED